jgi:hypothetical protein
VTAATSLNDRQRSYLQAIFDTDQSIEADMHRIPFIPLHYRPKASEWRWMEYSDPIPEIFKPASRLYAAIKQAARIDQGTGSTFAALAERGLIQVQERGPDHYLHIRMTPAGRKLVRSWAGAKAYMPPPAGTLQKWHWRALSLAYAAGDEGLEGEYGDYGHIGWNIWRRLVDYKWGALVIEGELRPPYDHRLRITEAGRRLYARQWLRYREMYPNVDAPEPA